MIKKIGVDTFYNHNFNTYCSFLAQYDDELHEQIKEKVLSQNQFPTGISEDLKSRSFGLTFPINEMTYTEKKGLGLNWTKSEYKRIFKNLKKSWEKLVSVRDIFTNSMSLVENEIYNFITNNESLLKDFDDFKEIKKQVYEVIDKEKGYSDVKEALLSKVENIYLNGLNDFYLKISNNIKYAQEHLQLFRIIINRILTLDECRFEYSIEIIVSILTNLLKYQEWILDIIPEYVYLLERFQKYLPQDIDIIYIESLLIKLAFVIKKYYPNFCTEIVNNWIKYKDESVFVAINKMALEKI